MPQYKYPFTHKPIAFNRRPQAAGGLAVYAKYGPDHMRRIGRRGYENMVKRHFSGDTEAANRWLASKGRYVGDETYRRRGLGKFADPGPHPAHLKQGVNDG
jgi:hypothetical protein